MLSIHISMLLVDLVMVQRVRKKWKKWKTNLKYCTKQMLDHPSNQCWINLIQPCVPAGNDPDLSLNNIPKYLRYKRWITLYFLIISTRLTSTGVRCYLLGESRSPTGQTQHWPAPVCPLLHPEGQEKELTGGTCQVWGQGWQVHPGAGLPLLLRGNHSNIWQFTSYIML